MKDYIFTDKYSSAVLIIKAETEEAAEQSLKHAIFLGKWRLSEIEEDYIIED